MTLQNRVHPDGSLHADPARGMLIGNRGGRFHDVGSQTLGRRRFVSRRWISCRLSFKDRHRPVWGYGYTELFFLDEAVALCAGHRPCFECRSDDAKVFAALFAEATGGPADADAMDRALHAERLGAERVFRTYADLPKGAFFLSATGVAAKTPKGPALWAFSGYRPMPATPQGRLAVLTPPLMLRILEAGYKPMWHPSVDAR